MFNNEFYVRSDADKKNALDELGFAALHTVVANVGGTLLAPTRALDSFGVDAVCEFYGRFTSLENAPQNPVLHVQLKSTTRPATVKDAEGRERFSLSIETSKLRRYLAISAVPLALVLYVAPPLSEIERWVDVSGERVLVRRSLFWTFLDDLVNLRRA